MIDARSDSHSPSRLLRWIGPACWALAVAIAVWIKPSEGALSSSAQGPEASLAVESVFLATVAIVVVAVLMIRYADKKHVTAWLIATTLLSIAAVWHARDYFNKSRDWTCEYAGGWKIVGTAENLKPEVRQAALEVGACQYLWMAGGEVEAVWSSESVRPRRTSIAWSYVLIPSFFACLMLSASQIAILAGASRAPDPLMDAERVAARAGFRIFINYRRADVEDMVDALDDYLSTYYGQQVFCDKRSISPGADFVTTVLAAVNASDVLFAVMGPRWLRAADSQGRRRLDDPSDLVRWEIVQALNSQTRVIPLLHSTTMPASGDLPTDMEPLARRNALLLRAKPDRTHDLRRIIDELDALAMAKARSNNRTAD